MSYDVEGKIAFVTGANRGIGRAIAEGLLQAGASKVYAAVRRPESVEDLINTFGDRVVAVEFDLTRPEAIIAAAKTASDATLVVNNAGVLKTASVLETDAIESLAFEMEANVHGLIRVAQAFSPVLAGNGGGALVQLNSVVSMKAFPQFGTYSASKAAAYSVTQSLRESLKPDGIHVVSVHPGPIATDMGDAAGLTEIAEPASLVVDGIISGLKEGEFHVFPDSMAKQIGAAYGAFAEGVVEAEMNEN